MMRLRNLIGVVLVGLVGGALAGSAQTKSCQKLELSGEVKAGQAWQAEIGGGWVFRLQPVAAGQAGYSGWDLVVDTESSLGYPDALLLATPPYNSIGAREIATTFGLRAQDALGWNPRPFRFLGSLADYREARAQFATLQRSMQPNGAAGEGSKVALERLLSLQKGSFSGEFRIENAGLTPGSADSASFAEAWAQSFPRTPHTVEPSTQGKPTARGEVHWMHFSVSIWLPKAWKAPKGGRVATAECR